jgi:uncharacterized membrane protein YjjP (DUF1212 family)
MNNKRITDAIEIAGLAVFVVGVGLVFFPAAVITAGVLMVVAGYAVGDG